MWENKQFQRQWLQLRGHEMYNNKAVIIENVYSLRLEESRTKGHEMDKTMKRKERRGKRDLLISTKITAN